MLVDVIIVPLWSACFAASFVIELLLNRRPVLVAAAVAIFGFLFLIFRDASDFSREAYVVAALYAAIALFGILPGLAGAALARFVRLWVETKRDGREVD